MASPRPQSNTPAMRQTVKDRHRMHSSKPSQRCTSEKDLTLKVLGFRSICVMYSTLCLVVLLHPSEAARLRCGSDLLADLIFVCGDRGFYLGRGNWSGYGSRPRGKGIVDHCCQPAGCDLQHLEMYCAKPKQRGRRHTTAYPTTPQPTTTQQVMVEQFRTVFQKRLLEHMGTPNSERRQHLRKKTNSSQKRRNKGSSRRRTHMSSTTSQPSTSQSVSQGTTQPL